MSVTVNIDGAQHSGNYRCDCECGANWYGQGEQISPVGYSPAMPLAEAVVHMRLAHHRAHADLRLSGRMEDWLETYWRCLSDRDEAQRRQKALGGIGR